MASGYRCHFCFYFILVSCLISQKSVAVDPSLDWWTIQSEHFNVHYPAYFSKTKNSAADKLAQKVTQVAESALIRVAEKLGSMPNRRIEIVITDDTDAANGSATVVPYRLVRVFASAPENNSVLNDYDDYLQILLIHELTHIVQMGWVSGLPKWINFVLGDTVFPNGAQPGWFVEGLAVYFESALSSAGRIRSSLFNMYLRTAVLAGVVPRLDQLSGSLRSWPQGTAPYLYGAFFIKYLTERFGEQVLTNLCQQTSKMLLPWSLNVIARRVLGFDYPTLYQDWLDEQKAKADALLARTKGSGLTEVELLTHRGQYQRRPRISPDGKSLVYFSGSVDAWSSLRIIDLTDKSDRVLLEVNSLGQADFWDAGRKLLFSQSEVVQQFYYYRDLYSVDLVTKHVQRLTEGLRTRSPDVSPDDKKVVFVRNEMGQTQIMLLDLSTHQLTQLTSFEDQSQVYTPRFSPDGKSVVFSKSRPKSQGRDLYLIDLQTRFLRQLTDTVFMDLDPVFAADGESILFSSDRTGLYNLYSLHLDKGLLQRLTNLISGGFAPDPAPDGSRIAFEYYGPKGYDIGWIKMPQQPYSLEAQVDKRPPVPYQTTHQDYQKEPYRPWSSLLPRAWFPIWGQDSWGETFGITLNGRDSVGKLSYLIDLSYGPANDQLYLRTGITARIFYPSLSFYFDRSASRQDLAIINGAGYAIERQELSLAVDLDFPFSTSRRYDSIFINYSVQLFDRWTPLHFDPTDLEPAFPDDSPLAFFSIGWYQGATERYIESISTEKGYASSVSLRYSSPALGSGSHLAQARFWLRGYVPLVPAWRHVLALGFQGGISIGDERRRGLFVVGGLPIRDVVHDAYYGLRYSGLYLRGYPTQAFVGSSYLLTSVEYRIPLVDIDAGIGTLPFYLKRLHAGLFVDMGGASSHRALEQIAPDLLNVGIGAELRLDLLLAYYLPFSIRLGYGRGLMEKGTHNWYLTLGTGY